LARPEIRDTESNDFAHTEIKPASAHFQKSKITAREAMILAGHSPSPALSGLKSPSVARGGWQYGQSG
jgi:hypothetical protein